MTTPIDNSFAAAISEAHYPWNSTVDMIQNMLLLMQHSSWVRRYLLDNGPQRAQDASILASKEHMKFAYTRTSRNEDNSGSYFTQIFVPVYSNGTIGAGVVSGFSNSFESSFLCGASRFAVDASKGTMLAVHDGPGPQGIIVIFESVGPISRQFAYLRFSRAEFLRAVQEDEMDFDLLYRYLLASCCGSTYGTNVSPPVQIGVPGFIVPNIFGSSIERKYTICVYANGVPLMVFNSVRVDSWDSHQRPFEIERIKRLGINSIQRRIPMRVPIQIAPAPAKPHGDASEMGEASARKEKRKIQKREAAARSYARRREKRIAYRREGEELVKEQAGEKQLQAASTSCSSTRAKTWLEQIFKKPKQ